MLICDWCGSEIEGAPFRRNKHVYCSKTCSEEHQFEVAGTDEEEVESELDDGGDDEHDR